MNKIYKLIWSKAKNCWVVASELAKGHGKNKSRIKNSLLAAFVMSALLAGGVTDIQALTPQEKEEIKNEVARDLLDKIINGGEISGVTSGVKTIPGAIALRIQSATDISGEIGKKMQKEGLALRYFGVRPDYYEPSRDYLERYANKDWTNVDNDGAFGAHSMALGYRAFSEAKHGVAIGRSALAGGSLWKGDYGGDGGVAIGNHAWALGDKSVSVGNAARAVHKGIAIGIQAEAGLDENDNTTDWSTAPGFTPKQGKSIQYDPKTKLPYVTSDLRDKMGAIAIGIDAKAHGNHSTAMGVGAKAKSRYAWSFGYSSEASGVGSIAFGSRATAKGTNAIAIGSGNYDRPNQGAQAYSGDTIAIGRGSVAGNEEDTAAVYNSVAVGREARAYGKNSIALGGTANVGDIWQKQLADGGTAIGSSANAALENATAIGYKSIAYAKDAVTLGANTRADIDGGVALGSDSNVGSYSSSSYGKAGKVGYDPLDAGTDETSTWKSTRAAVSVGNQQKGITRQIINVAAGTDNTDAVNVAQLKSLRQRAWKDLAAAKDELGGRIAGNTTSITALSGKVRTNTQDIGRLKTDVQTNDTRIRYLYDNMPFMHYVSVKSEGMAPNEGNYKNDGAKKRGAIAIGAHTSSDGDGAVALGAHSFVRGQGSVIVGENSDNYTGGEPTKKGQFDQSIILGSDNTIFAQDAKNGGREDKVIGNMNRVEESHGTFVRGTGNFVYDAYNPEALTDEDKQKEQDFLDPIDGGDPTGLFQKGRSHVSVEGDGNLVSGSLYTQVSGVGNHLSNTDNDDGTSTPKVTYNIVTGNRNTVADSSHNLIMGDNHQLENVNGNIIIGSQKTKTKTEKSNVTILGNDANVSVEGGVALGTGSVASTAAEVAGYDPLTGEVSAKTTSTWKSGNGAVSVGTAEKTRQITNLAAGTQDTDAVNVAQLKSSKTAVEAGDYVTVTKKTEDGKGTTYTVKGPKLTAEDNLTVTDDVDNNKKIGYKVKLNKDLMGLTSVTSDAFKVGDKTYINSQGINANGNKITNVAAGTEDGDAVNFKQLSDVKTKVETNETNIGKLQAGFTVKDGGAGKADVTLGGDTKQEVTFKAAVDKTTEATANGSSLTSAVDADRNVTYSLNMKQLKQDLGITDGPDGVMSSWKLQAAGDTTPQEIKNGNTVTFDVEKDQGLTVTRNGAIIKYGVNNTQFVKNINDGDTAVTNIAGLFSVTDGTNTKAVNLGKGKNNNVEFLGTADETTVTVGGEDDKPTVTVGLAKTFKDKVTANEGNITELQKGWTLGVARGDDSQTDHEATASGESQKIGAGDNVTLKAGRGVKLKQDGANIQIGLKFIDMDPAGYPFDDAKATGGGSLAVGQNSVAGAHQATAVGFDTKANQYGVALGAASEAGKSAVAIGNKALANGEGSIAIGTSKQKVEGYPDKGLRKVDSEDAIAIGTETAVDGSSRNATAVGAYADIANSPFSTALGNHSKVENASNATAVGNSSTVKDAAYGTALGNFSRVENAAFGTALGNNAAVIDAQGGVAIGAHSVANRNALMPGYNPTGEQWSNFQDYLEKTGQKDAYDQATAKLEAAKQAWAADKDNPELRAKVAQATAEQNKIVNVWAGTQGAVSIGNEQMGFTRQLTGVAAGTQDTDAVNVAQLKALKDKVTGNEGDITTLQKGWTLEDAAGSKKVVKAEDTVKVTGDDYINATVSDDGLTLGMNETKLNKQINDQIDNSATVKAKMNSWVLKATSDKDAEKDGKTIDNDNNAVTFDATGKGLTVTRDGSTIKYGIDGSAIDISENKTVADLKTDIKNSKTTVTGDDASGVKVENTAADGQPANYKVSLGDKVKAGDVTVDGTKGAGQITGLSNTTWDAGNIVSGRAATEDQLKAVSQNAAEAAKKHTTMVAGDYVTVSEGTNANGGKEYTVTGPKVAVAKDEKNLVVGDIMDGNKKVGYELKLNKELTGLTSVSSDTFKSGENVTINKDGLTIKEGPSVTTKGIDAGKKKITNVADGGVSENSTDAVNGGQLYKLQQTVAGNKVTVEAAKNSQITVTPETQADKSTKYVVDIAKDGTIGGAKDGNLVTGDTVKKYVDANKVTVTGDEDGSGVKVENVAKTGEPANYKVSLGDKIKAGDVTVDGTKGAGQITGLSNTTWDAGNIVSGRAATEDQLKAVSQNAAEAAKKHTTMVAGDYVTVSEGTNANGGKEYTVTGPKVAVAKDEKNLVVGDIMDGNKKVGYELKLNKELTGLTSVSSTTFKAGDNVTINNEGLTIKEGPSVTTGGINAGDKKITNVAAGAVSEKSTEAVNGGQLFGVEQKVNINSRNISILGGKVSELNTRVNRVGAGAAALAALHPLDFDPDDKWDFAAGYGNYKGANAAAIGAYYRPNEDTMVSVGGSFGGGENMVNAGVSVKLGQGNRVTTSRVAMAKEIKDLRAEVEVLRQAVTGIGQGQTPDPVKMKLFPDIAKNHWAYEAVEELTKQGLLEGYPDGTFGGDRMMTRYEFATLVYRAMQKGLNVNEKLIQEFEPELERFRIDVISKDKNGNPVIERVRVNEKKKAK